MPSACRAVVTASDVEGPNWPSSRSIEPRLFSVRWSSFTELPESPGRIMMDVLVCSQTRASMMNGDEQRSDVNRHRHAALKFLTGAVAAHAVAEVRRAPGAAEVRALVLQVHDTRDAARRA